MEDEPREHLGIAHHDAAGDGRGRRRPAARRRGVHERDELFGAGGDLAGGVAVVGERRRRHPVDDEAIGLAAPTGHGLHRAHDLAGARAHDDRLARATKHRRHLGDVVHRLRHVARQPHAHHEVDVGKELAERRRPLDVRGGGTAPQAAVWVEHVEAVGACAEVRLAVAQRERTIGAARADVPFGSARWPGPARRATRRCGPGCPRRARPQPAGPAARARPGPPRRCPRARAAWPRARARRRPRPRRSARRAGRDLVHPPRVVAMPVGCWFLSHESCDPPSVLPARGSPSRVWRRGSARTERGAEGEAAAGGLGVAPDAAQDASVTAGEGGGRQVEVAGQA